MRKSFFRKLRTVVLLLTGCVGIGVIYLEPKDRLITAIGFIVLVWFIRSCAKTTEEFTEHEGGFAAELEPNDKANRGDKRKVAGHVSAKGSAD
jgi:hypothetical protein